MLAHDALRRGAHEGRLAGQHLVEHATQTVDVAPPIQLCAPHALLGAHVQGRSHRETGLRQFVASRRVDRAGDAKVRHDGVTRFEEDVLGLDVAVHHALGVGIAQGIRDLAPDLHGILQRQLSLAGEAVAQRLPFDVRHDVVQEARSLARVVQRQDMWMGESGGEVDLPEESLGAERRRELRPQDLQRDGAIVLHVAGEVHDRHTPVTELALDRVVISEGGTKAVPLICLHSDSSYRAAQDSQRGELAARGMESHYRDSG